MNTPLDRPQWIQKPVVICVDDDRRILASLSRLFRGEPYEVRLTHRPEEALQWLAGGNVDVFITDQQMMGMSGSEVLRTVRLRSPGTARVMLTACPDSNTLLDRAGRTIEKLLTKPWDDEALKRTIRQLVDPGGREALKRPA